ncbi:hypothetical protein ALCH109712_16410 [Alkalicoccus chagannorensis]
MPHTRFPSNKDQQPALPARSCASENLVDSPYQGSRPHLKTSTPRGERVSPRGKSSPNGRYLATGGERYVEVRSQPRRLIPSTSPNHNTSSTSFPRRHGWMPHTRSSLEQSAACSPGAVSAPAKTSSTRPAKVVACTPKPRRPAAKGCRPEQKARQTVATSPLERRGTSRYAPNLVDSRLQPRQTFHLFHTQKQLPTLAAALSLYNSKCSCSSSLTRCRSSSGTIKYQMPSMRSPAPVSSRISWL